LFFGLIEKAKESYGQYEYSDHFLRRERTYSSLCG